MNGRYGEEVREPGVAYVSIPKQEYEILLRRAAELNDLQALHHAKYLLAQGEEPMPMALTKSIIQGEHPVRVFRKHRGFTQADLARTSGVNRAYISEIENGKKQGSLSAIKALAKALRVSLDDLV